MRHEPLGAGNSAVWVPKMWSWALTRHDAPTSCGSMYRILYRLLVSLARLAVRSGRSKDLEVMVLRHQITVLHRLNNRPALADEDRALLGAVAAALSRPQRAGWLVAPETLLRWHRRRIARHWTQPCRAPGRRRLVPCRRLGGLRCWALFRSLAGRMLRVGGWLRVVAPCWDAGRWER